MMKNTITAIIVGIVIVSCNDEGINLDAPVSATINGDYWYASDVDVYYLNHTLNITASNVDQRISITIVSPQIGINDLSTSHNSNIYYTEHVTEQFSGSWKIHHAPDAIVHLSLLDTTNASVGQVSGEFSVDFVTDKINITKGIFNVSTRQLYCNPYIDPTLIEDHNLLGEWELIEIENENMDTTYYPACSDYKKYTPTISFTDTEVSKGIGADGLICNINLGVNDMGAVYSILSVDSIIISCGSKSLSVGSPYSDFYEDVYGTQICTGKPLNYRFTDYYLLLTNRDNVVLKYIIIQ